MYRNLQMTQQFLEVLTMMTSDKQHLQNYLDELVKWSEKWQMLYNFGKSRCVHTGHGNLDVNYKTGDTVLVLGTTVKKWLCYEEQLKECGLTTLEKRQLRQRQKGYRTRR